MDPSTLLLLALLTPWGPIEGDRNLVRETYDLEEFQWAIHGNMICLDFEGLATAAGQAGAIELMGTEFPGVTLSAPAAEDGLFVGIPDPSLDSDDSFFAPHLSPVSGEAFLSPRLNGIPHGRLVIDFENPVLGVGAQFLDVDGPGTSIEVFDGPGGTGTARGSLDLQQGDTFAGLTTWYIHSAVITLGTGSDGVGLDDLCFENPFQVKSQELFFDNLTEVTCIDFEGIAHQSGAAGVTPFSGDIFPGLTLIPGQGSTGLFAYIPDAFSNGILASSGEAVSVTDPLPETPNGVLTVNLDEPVDGFGSYFTDVEDQITQIEVFDAPDAGGRSLGKVRWTNNEDGFVGILGQGIQSAKFWLGGYGDGVALDDMCYGHRIPRSCRVDEFGDGPPAAHWTLDTLGDADVADAWETNGVLNLTGNGSELYHGSDNGAFLHQSQNGDFRAELDIVAVDPAPGQDYRKGGLMVRESTDPLAPRVMINYLPDFPDPLQPGPALQFDARLTHGGTATEMASTVKGISLPVRVAVERTGHRFRIFYSTDGGVSWNHPKGGLGGEAAIPMAPTVRVGPMVASYDAAHPFTVSFDRAQICPPDLGPIPSCASDSFDQGLHEAWTLSALGNTDQIATDSSAGTLKLTGDGTSAYIGPDHGAFLHQTVDGDFRIEVDVLDFPVNAGGPYRKAGLMVRAGLDALSRRVMVQYIPDFNGQGPALQFRARTSEGGPGDVALGSNLFGAGLPVRLAIEHTGGIYTVEFSTDDGATWRRPAGGSNGQIPLDLGPQPLAGLHAVSYDTETALTVELDDFTVSCEQ